LHVSLLYVFKRGRFSFLSNFSQGLWELANPIAQGETNPQAKTRKAIKTKASMKGRGQKKRTVPFSLEKNSQSEQFTEIALFVNIRRRSNDGEPFSVKECRRVRKAGMLPKKKRTVPFFPLL